MASAAKWRDDNNGTLVTAGSSTAYTVTSNQVEAALTAGYTIAVQFHATCDTSATLAVDGLTAKPLQVIAGTNLKGAEYRTGSIARFTYSTTGTGQWIANGAEAAIPGVTDGSNSPAGLVGEYQSVFVTSGSGVSMTNSVAVNITSLSLTAGDWDIYSEVFVRADSGHIYFLYGALSTATGETTVTGATVPATGRAFAAVIPSSDTANTAVAGFPVNVNMKARATLSSSITFFLNGWTQFDSTTFGYGSIQARRMR
jgi:hypothetical protein